MAGTIAEFFRDQNVFITGGTGSVGRVLVEKLLRSCPDVRNIYLLIRDKKGANIEERMKKYFNMIVFENMREKSPQSFKKIVPIQGDCMELNLGISENDYQTLVENVTVVIHCAATVRFNESLKTTVLLNTRATREMMLLARKMKNLKIVEHVSTCYCQYDKSVVEERCYPPPADWRKMIEMVETIDEHVIDILTPKLIGKHPNTYVYSKALAEGVVRDLGEGLPCAIIRPSIISSAFKDPAPGWSDFYGPHLGLFLSGGKGLLRSVYVTSDSKYIFDAVPVDYVVKILCIVAWKEALSGNCEGPSVYNVSGPKQFHLTLREIVKKLFSLAHKYPLVGCLWVPRALLTDCYLLFRLSTIFTQFLPCLFLDSLAKLVGQKPILTKIQRKLYVNMVVIRHFTVNYWIFKNENVIQLEKHVPASDKDFTVIDIHDVTVDEYMITSYFSCSRMLLNITPGSDRGKRNLLRMLLFEKLLMISIVAAGIWLLFNSEFVQSTLSHMEL